MTKEEILEQLKHDRDLCNFNPSTGESEPIDEDCRKSAEALDYAIKAIKIVEEFERAQIITGGRLNGRTYAYKCGLEDGKRKALEQQPTTQEILSHIETGITATGQSDSYCVGFCNALIWLKACITHEEPQYFKDVTPTLKMPKGNTITVGKIEL